MQALNILYTMQNGDGATYNWCNCPSDLTIGEAWGILLGIMAVVAIGTFLCTFFCPCCRRKSDDVNPMEVTLTNQRPMI